MDQAVETDSPYQTSCRALGMHMSFIPLAYSDTSRRWGEKRGEEAPLHKLSRESVSGREMFPSVHRKVPIYKNTDRPFKENMAYNQGVFLHVCVEERLKGKVNVQHIVRECVCGD